MIVKDLYVLQKQLDERIDYHEDDRKECKYLALLVEVGELANEVQSFKFWKAGRNQHRTSLTVTLEEYVDCLHFILSLGIENKWQPNEVFSFVPSIPEWNINKHLALLFETIMNTRKYEQYFIYEHLFQVFLGFGKLLGYGEAEIRDAYLAKNEVNHERQESGY